jgi:signal peptidase II
MMRAFMLFVSVISIFVLLSVDQIAKLLTVNIFALYEERVIIPDFFSLTYIQNSGAAWGFLSNNTNLLIVISVPIIAMLGWLMLKSKKKKILTSGLIFIIAGALGNLVDRIRIGYVVDMLRLDFLNFPVFNIADVMLTFGVLLMITDYLSDKISNVENKNH